MNVVFIGAGNLATNLAIGLKEHHFNIIQVYSRSLESAKPLAQKLACEATNNLKEIKKQADLYIFSVKDAALHEIIRQMPATKGIWVHTAGSLPMDIFKGYTNDYGVVYPLQTFSKERKPDFSKIPFFMEANTPVNLEKIKAVFSNLSATQIELSSEKRKYLHLAAVFSCNFTNHLYTISKEILEQEGLCFEWLVPLIDETTAKIHTLSPEKAQTGPAVRFDENIITGQLNLISDKTRKEIYRLISEDIYYTLKQK